MRVSHEPDSPYGFSQQNYYPMRSHLAEEMNVAL
jgi:hypothetical protein